MDLKIERDESNQSLAVYATPSDENGILFVKTVRDGIRGVGLEKILIEGMAKNRVARAARTGDTSELMERYVYPHPYTLGLLVLPKCVAWFPVPGQKELQRTQFLFEYSPYDHLSTQHQAT